MPTDPSNNVAARIVLPGTPLDATLAFFVEELGFGLETVWPADDPRSVVVAGYGVRIELQRDRAGDPGEIVLTNWSTERGERIAPNGTRITLVPRGLPLVVPPLQASVVVTRSRDDSSWRPGRAGMLYRDLIPGRQGGRFVASHIRIPEGGPVPDYVHYHDVRFQLIHCLRGWVRVVYEDQGPAFRLEPGDSVLQPPGIRHRVLEASRGMEVLEVTSPAEHATHTDPQLELPTATHRPERDFGAQRFVHSRASDAQWVPWRIEGWTCRETGIAAATGGMASVRVARPDHPMVAPGAAHDGELRFLFVARGNVQLLRPTLAEHLEAGDSVVIPPRLLHRLSEPSADLELIEVTLPA